MFGPKPYASNGSIVKGQFPGWTDDLLIQTKKQFDEMKIDHHRHLNFSNIFKFNLKKLIISIFLSFFLPTHFLYNS